MQNSAIYRATWRWLLLACLGLLLRPLAVLGEEEKYVAPIYPAAQPIAIDGDITDAKWGGDRLAWPIEIEEYGTMATFWLRYDQTNLYGAFKVVDSSPAKNTRLMGDRWDGDQIEVCLGTDPVNHTKHASFGDYDYQFFLGTDGEGKVNAFVNQPGKQNGLILPGSKVAIKIWPDGKGYNLEFAIPWASLLHPDYFQPVAGVQIGFQIQLDFSTPDGQREAYVAKWWPHGIHFQHPSDWAWAKFLAPGEELLAPHHNEAAVVHTGTEVQFPTPADGLVSVNITDDQGNLIRRLVIGQHLKKGVNAVLWDGKDDAGTPVPPGVYQLKGSVGNLGVKYLTTLGNTSPEPYGGLRKSSGGEYRHGCWSDAIMNPDGTFYVLNWGGEGPPSLQQIDPKQQFRVIWGGTTDNSGNQFQEYGCRDGNTLYFTHNCNAPAGKEGVAQRSSTLSCMEAVTHKEVRFANGAWSIPLGEAHADADVRGLGAFKDKIYVPCFYENRVDIYDGASGEKVGTLTQPAFNGPADVSFAPDGTMYVIDKTSVHVFSPAGDYLGRRITGLTQGWSVASGPGGKIYLSDYGANQVKIYSAQGRLLTTMGPNGGATVTVAKYGVDGVGGKIADDWFYHPQGVVVDAAGNLVVVDEGNLRVQYFNASGKCLKSLQAEVYEHVVMDTRHPDDLYVAGQAGVLLGYHIDWRTGKYKETGQYTTTFFHPSFSDKRDMALGSWTGMLKYHDGKPYFFNGTWPYPQMVWTFEHGRQQTRTILERAGWAPDEVIPLFEKGQVIAKSYAQVTGSKETYSIPWEYRDANGDGLPQLGEYHFYTKAPQPARSSGTPQDSKAANWDLILMQAENLLRIPCQGFDKADNPIYTWDKSTLLFSPSQDPAWNEDKFQAPQIGGITSAPDGSVYLVVLDRPSFDPLDLRFRKYGADGKRQWSICHVTHGFWHKPGEELTWITSIACVNGLLALTEETGSFEFFNPDGLYLGTLLEPSDMRPDMHGTDVRYQPTGECWGGIVFKHPKTGRVYMVAQPNAQPLVLLYEVTGSDKVQYFTGSCRLTAGGK